MDSIEAHLIQLLDGKTRKSADDVFVDFSLEDQVDELAAKGVESQLKNYKPITKKTVTYIVAAVIINEESEVLMMQEAKSDCAGTWYLPAGRVEPGEDLVSAVRREVQEETGLICEPTSLLMVENAGGSWYRFVFTGTVTGGQLKTVSQADSESLQAKWFSDLNQLDLRSKDILPLVDKALSYWHERSSFHKPMLPALVAHPKLLLRLIVVIRKKENNQIHVLVSNKGSEAHLPVCEINPTRSIHASLKRYMQNMFRRPVTNP
ncbi:8-oxo-dGDP phosphatase NUDT18 [Halotydeus destructor]|nr:8-oxo-dGDP phosphatase NUDT18 [Halotydeus destructor]